MKTRKPSSKQMLLSCAEIGPEDGVDPRQLRGRGRRKPPNRKTLRLCEQVGRTLASVLAGEAGDDVLRELQIESVLPSPGPTRLLVTVSLLSLDHSIEPAEVLRRLQGAMGRIRSEVAAAVHRRLTPELAFCVITRGEIS